MGERFDVGGDTGSNGTGGHSPGEEGWIEVFAASVGGVVGVVGVGGGVGVGSTGVGLGVGGEMVLLFAVRICVAEGGVIGVAVVTVIE